MTRTQKNGALFILNRLLIVFALLSAACTTGATAAPLPGDPEDAPGQTAPVPDGAANAPQPAPARVIQFHPDPTTTPSIAPSELRAPTGTTSATQWEEGQLEPGPSIAPATKGVNRTSKSSGARQEPGAPYAGRNDGARGVARTTIIQQQVTGHTDPSAPESGAVAPQQAGTQVPPATAPQAGTLIPAAVPQTGTIAPQQAGMQPSAGLAPPALPNRGPVPTPPAMALPPPMDSRTRTPLAWRARAHELAGSLRGAKASGILLSHDFRAMPDETLRALAQACDQLGYKVEAASDTAKQLAVRCSAGDRVLVILVVEANGADETTVVAGLYPEARSFKTQSIQDILSKADNILSNRGLL